MGYALECFALNRCILNVITRPSYYIIQLLSQNDSMFLVYIVTDAFDHVAIKIIY